MNIALIAAIVAFSIAAIFCFIGSVTLLTIVGIIAIGLALFAASAYSPALRR